MLQKLKRLYWTITVQFGVQPLQTLSAVGALPSFIRDYVRFRRGYAGSMQLMPCLHDQKQQAGDTKSEYFIQDLSVAKRIFARNPVKHVDVGSRIDGFVAHVASFRTIEVIDIRPMVGEIPGIVFTQADLTDTEASPASYCDSLSCLHALEHFGLGRYGDNVDPMGWRSGIRSLARILRPGGRLYLSTPIGRERVVFNAHRVFAPAQIIDAASECGLSLDHLSWIQDGDVTTSGNFAGDSVSLSHQEYSLGIFEFLKT